MSTLKKRFITAIILLPIVLGLLFYGSLWLLAVVVSLVMLVCAWEWTKLIPINYIGYATLFILLIFLILAFSYKVFSYWLVVGMVIWLFILIAVLTYPESKKIWGKKWIVAAAGLVVLPLFAEGLSQIYLLTNGKQFLLYLLLLIWAADIGAYFCGKAWGEHKLIPQVSPGKSWEGVLGGIILALIIAALGYFWFSPGRFFIWMILALLTVLISILGDLFISVLKRRLGIKDTGAILPGHGGILDRLDSLIAAIPFFYFGLTNFSFGI